LVFKKDRERVVKDGGKMNGGGSDQKKDNLERKAMKGRN
jgi:hypothetical protein